MNKARLWAAGVLATAALVLLAAALAVPFLDDPPAGVTGSVATLLVAAEVLAALAILAVGRELYGKLWARLRALRAELSEQTTRGDDRHE